MLGNHINKSIRKSFLFIAFCGLVVSAANAEPVLDQSTFTAAGYHDTLLHIDTPGRYSIQAHSQQGTALELVDRMAGPMFEAGVAGKQDGRVDAFLDEGTYKIRLYSHNDGTGDLELTVYPFQEIPSVTEDFPVLKDLEIEHGELGDLQQRSFWIYLKKRQLVRLEVLGRNLKDCRIWRNGDWLVDAFPQISIYEPVTGQPMMYVEFYHNLNPGLYRLTCYGGEALEWANESQEHPFYLRKGIPQFGTNGQKIVTISPFGRDVFVVSGATDFFELTRKDKKDTLLRVSPWHEKESRHREGQDAIINKESRDPWCDLTAGNADNPQFVTVQGTPGDTLAVSYFTQRSEYYFPRESHREYWISYQASAAAGDTIDVTALLTRRPRNSSRTQVVQSQVIEVGFDKTYFRKINLLGTITVFLKVLEPGTYVIEELQGSGAQGEYQIEPVWSTRPKDYTPPPFTLPETPLELTKGFYTLTIKPRSKGILAFLLRKKRVPPSTQPLDEEGQIKAQRILWSQVSIDSRNHEYILRVNTRHDVVSGLIVRPLPLDLNDPLPVTLLPGEQVPIRTHVKKNSKVLVQTDQAASFEIVINTRQVEPNSLLSPGKYVLIVKNTSPQPALFTVQTLPVQAAPTIIQETQEFPALTEKEPLYRNFDREEKQHFTLLVDEPGLYRLETGGRLATRLTIRSRLNTSLFSAEQNGVGRNALIQQYLRPGEYQVTVQTLGKSKGRASIHLRRTALIEEEGLKVGIREKIHLAPDEAVKYRLEIEQGGDYQLRTLGLNKEFPWRLEDDEGWPLIEPNQTGPIEGYFGPGSFYYYSLPQAVESRRITVLEPIAEIPVLEGKGPHPLTFNTEIEHVWREKEGHPPDIFVLDVPDPVDATVYLAEDMEAGVYNCTEPTPNPSQEGNCAEEIGWIIGGKSRTFDQLLPGRYEIKVKSILENDRLPYTLLVETGQLITGLRYTIDDLPASFTVSTGDDRLVELFSFGTIDVKAALWQSGQLIAQNDDMENDWNFSISQKLNAGSYLLRLEPVGADDQGFLEVGMMKRNDRSFSDQGFPFVFETELEKEVVIIPFTTSSEESLTHIAATGDGAVKLALFQGNRMLAESKQELFIPLKASTQYSLLLWRLDDTMGNISIAAQALLHKETSLSAQQTEIPFSYVMEGIGGFKLIDAEKISYRLQRDPAAVRMFFSPGVEQAFKEVNDVPVVMPEHSGWLLWEFIPNLSTERPPGIERVQDKILITPFSLQEETELVEVGHVPLPFDFEQTTDAPTLIEIKSVGASLGAMVVSEPCEGCGTFARFTPNWFGMWMEPSQTLIAIPGSGTYRGTIWPTSDEAVRSKVQIYTRTFPLTQQSDWGNVLQHEGELQPGEIREIGLTETAQTLDILLTDGLVAFVWQNGHTEAIAAATTGNIQQQIKVSGGKLFLLNRGQKTGLYRVEKQEYAPEFMQMLDAETGFEKVFTSSGKLELRVEAEKPIFVAGDQIKSRFLGDDGRVRTVEPTPNPSQEGNYTAHVPFATSTAHVSFAKSWTYYPPGSGLLEVSYEPGYVRVWQSELEDAHRNFIASEPLMTQEIEAESLQTGSGTLEDRDQLWTFSLEQSVYIIAITEAPGITAILSGEQVLTTSTGSGNTGRQLVYFLQPGAYQLWTRPLKGLSQHGELRLHKVPPYSLNAETSSKTWLIRAGEFQVFRFEVTTTSKVGVGVQTESEQLEAQLFDTQFHLLAEGPLMFKELDTGEYILTVKTLAPDSPPVQYRPLVFGHHGSLQGIPAEVIEQYQKFAR